MNHKRLPIMLVCILLLTACSLLGGGQVVVDVPTPIVTTTTTAVPSTTATATTAADAPTATATTQAPITATAPAAACSDAATFVGDLTVPDNSQMAPGVGFVKTWRVRNSGTCTWDGRYSLVHSGGDLLGAITASFPLPLTVAPGQTADLSVSLVSPGTAGRYESDWKLSNAQGTRFGVGSSSAPMWVKIEVTRPQPARNSSISGFAWQDKNGDNRVDANEMLPGVTIALSTGPECRVPLTSMKTDGNGRFSFTQLPSGAYCLTGTDGSVTVGQAGLVLGANQQLTDVNVTWPPIWPDPVTIAGAVYQDVNDNGAYDAGEPPVANREVWLINGPCHVSAAPLATTLSAADGRYTFKGAYDGRYCLGLTGPDGLEDVAVATVSPGQVVDNVHLRVVTANASINGYLWSDYCSVGRGGDGYPVVDGNCVPDGNGGYRADGMIEPNEGYIAGVTMRLQAGPCTGDNTTAVATAVTAYDGSYAFTGLQGGAYCVYMNAAENGNAAILLPGDWTFPAPGIWYQQITLRPGDRANSVNFGWDYQLD